MLFIIDAFARASHAGESSIGMERDFMGFLSLVLPQLPYLTSIGIQKTDPDRGRKSPDFRYQPAV